jgi:hypothetical protein
MLEGFRREMLAAMPAAKGWGVHVLGMDPHLRLCMLTDAAAAVLLDGLDGAGMAIEEEEERAASEATTEEARCGSSPSPSSLSTPAARLLHTFLCYIEIHARAASCEDISTRTQRESACARAVGMWSEEGVGGAGHQRAQLTGQERRWRRVGLARRPSSSLLRKPRPERR